MTGQNQAVPRVGVFWVAGGQVFGRSRPLREALEGVAGLLDSPDEHAHVWEDETLVRPAGARCETDYTRVPRGRTLFAKASGTAVVFLDDALGDKTVRRAIREFFGLQGVPVVWRHDPHYTTSPDRLARLFD